MYILSLSFGLSNHTSVNSWQNHFKISKVVVDKRTSGCRSITSSIYLNWNVSVIYCRIEIKLVSVKVEWRWILFCKNYFFKVTSGLADKTSLSFQLRIFLLFYVRMSHNLVTDVWIWYHIKYYVTLKVTLTFGVNGKVNAYSFLLSLGLSVHNSVNSWPNYFKLSTMVVDKGTSDWIGITSSLYLKAYLRYLLSDRDQTCFSLSRMMMTFISLKNTFLCHFRSSRHDVFMISIADISLIKRWIESKFDQREEDSPYNFAVI